jgi:hemerythrin
MIAISWGPQYLVGNDMLDHQHQVFADLIRSSSDAIESRRGEESVRRSLEELVLFAKFHFFAEESMMINTGYPASESHMNEHALLLSALEEKIDEYLGDTEAGKALIAFTFQWLVLHTLTVDKPLATHLRSHRRLEEL